ncbi:isoprenyl transferase [Coprobacillus sp. CAG:605]|nr:isoprenyl transferase [Coprobacillus sp. CAG:605]
MNEEKIPNHVAIILDGNRRWAKEHKLPKLEGHRRGFENIRKLTNYIFSRGVKYLSVFAFSTENFKRTQDEVKYLMDMFVKEFKKEYVSLHKDNIKVIFSGRKSGLRSDVLEAMEEISSLTKDNTGGVFNICLNYGGHAEIVDATKDIVKLVLDNKLSIDDITEEDFAKHLYQDLPPIDLMIRTSGEVRLSNFMLWQLSYAEMYFPDCHWPAFNENEFDKAIRAYNGRERRFGGNSK